MHMDFPMPVCVNTSQCRVVNIGALVPINWALPLYGYVMPLIVAITIATNSFIVLVLSHRALRTPTNYVLLGMAVTELLTGLSCLPWLLYYYTLGGYITDIQWGLPPFWCVTFPYLASVLPSMFHMAAIWSTVYLAVQRYIYICHPKYVTSMCTIKKSKQVIIGICIVSVLVYAPEVFATYNESLELHDSRTNVVRHVCLRWRTGFPELVGGINLYHYVIYALHTIFAHTLPCILLVCFTWKLILAIRRADKRYACLRSQPLQQQAAGGKGNSAESTNLAGLVIENETSLGCGDSITGASPCKGSQTGENHSHHSLNQKRNPTVGGHSLATAAVATATSCSTRGSVSESRRVQGLKQNTRMLITVIILFLITEIPAALIFSLHVSTVALRLSFIRQHYTVLNKLLIVRNVLIVMTYPLRFAIYCGMSHQFREVVRQMLAHRPRLSAFIWPLMRGRKKNQCHMPRGNIGNKQSGHRGSCPLPQLKRGQHYIHSDYHSQPNGTANISLLSGNSKQQLHQLFDNQACESIQHRRNYPWHSSTVIANGGLVATAAEQQLERCISPEGASASSRASSLRSSIPHADQISASATASGSEIVAEETDCML